LRHGGRHNKNLHRASGLGNCEGAQHRPLSIYSFSCTHVDPPIRPIDRPPIQTEQLEHEPGNRSSHHDHPGVIINEEPGPPAGLSPHFSSEEIFLFFLALPTSADRTAGEPAIFSFPMRCQSHHACAPAAEANPHNGCIPAARALHTYLPSRLTRLCRCEMFHALTLRLFCGGLAGGYRHGPSETNRADHFLGCVCLSPRN
jgi:hypothetical protein